jgi:pimeloyl-ACP methyl ester carboxylesterase
MPTDKRLVYLCGLAGNVGLSPAMQALSDDGWEVIIPSVPGYDGKSGFVAPDDYIDWLVTFWDALDATGALPCPVIGASIGGMIAADLAVFRPEAVTKLALLAPFGTTDADHPGFDMYAVPSVERFAHLFAKGVPDEFNTRFDHLGAEEAPVARYLSDIASASLYWPFGERGVGKRLHRIRAPRLTIWGDLDEVNPVSTAPRWGDCEVIVGAGHMVEWDAPEAVTDLLRAFLGGC